jgi:signal peptidase I
MNMMTKLWTAWRTHRYWNRACDEGKHLVRESRRILKRRSYRIPQTVADEIGLAVAEVESAAKGDDFERMREAIAALDERMDKHLAFARKSTAREYAESIGVALAVALLLRAFVVEAFQIPSGSMIPTLEIGDHIFVSKFAYGIGIPFTNKKVVEFSNPQRGDIIVFRYPPDPSTDFIKRVVGLPGDSVELRHNQVFINGQPMLREHVAGECRYNEGRSPEEARDCELWIESLGSKTHKVYQDPNQPPQDWGPRVVPPRSVFVMGDNRDNSRDSRVWGFVPYDNVKGRALVVWWSRDPAYGGWSAEGVAEWFKSIRFSRFFSVVR